MKRNYRFSFLLCAAGATLAACNSGAPSSQSPFSPQIDSKRAAQREPWMAGGVSKQDLLYVTNGNGEVTVYRYWKRALVGVLTNFTQPMGLCVDANQNVYITDHAAQQILEFAHGGTKPIKTLDDSPDSPYTCSVDAVTGNLAVTNDDGASVQGNLAIWPGASGTRITYADSSIGRFRGCAYDNAGNLLLTNGSAFAWLPKGGPQLVDISVRASKSPWSNVTGIQWDGKFFAIDHTSVYRFSLIHGQAYYVGQTSLSFSGTAIGPFWIYNNDPSRQGTQVLAAARDGSVGWVTLWKYPAGGSSIDEITHGLDEPFGVAVSLKKH